MKQPLKFSIVRDRTLHSFSVATAYLAGKVIVEIRLPKILMLQESLKNLGILFVHRMSTPKKSPMMHFRH